ncbi:unnamed protein product [Staurois parvus]|uniref:Uncharacterized protein n=1 Tax=Staurois parvus TaxID=386267 RepID=A0ABN9EKN9_9NEOB|nr:unnamed protein product [Staurois parvus]
MVGTLKAAKHKKISMSPQL